MSLASTSLRKPKNWQDFERSTRVLFTNFLNDPNTQQNGRPGQRQNGVDIYGYRERDVNCLVGVQCKEKLESAVTEDELRIEVEKAKHFKPVIREFILVTTAPRDQNIQEAARAITSELARSDHPIFVSVWGWEDVEDYASQHAAAWKAFDPTHNPFVEQTAEALTVKIDNLTRSFDQYIAETRSASRGHTDVSSERSDNETPRQGRITALQELIDDGYAQLALEQLLKLRTDDWPVATRSERYRILVGIASAKLKLGKYTEAGNTLLDAYSECGEHKNALTNRAKGYLLTNDAKQAEKVARQILANDDSNARAAETLIQALISDHNCNEPLDEIPEALRETEEVLISHICFLRARQNRHWEDVVKRAINKFPNSRLLKLFFAEAVLDTITRTNRDVIAGGLFSQDIGWPDFRRAVAELHAQATEAIDKGCALLPSTAQNAALALRFTGEIPKAKEILDAAIAQHPEDESLRVQRAIIAYSDNDPFGARHFLPSKPSSPEAIEVFANVLVSTGSSDDALALLNGIDYSHFPRHVQRGLLTARIRAYVKQGERTLAVDTIRQCVVAEPKSHSLRNLQILAHRLIADEEGAKIALRDALAIVDDQTSLRARLALSFEARRLGEDDVIVDLLFGRVAIDRESEALYTLLGAAINSRRWVTARETLASIPQEIQDRDWFRKAVAILAINTGDTSADEKIARYLLHCPNDAEVLLVRLGIWLRAGRDGDIRSLLKRIDLTNLDGIPEQRIQIGAWIVHYGEAARGLQYAYEVLMDNWAVPQVHLSYQRLMLLNEKPVLGGALPSATQIAIDTVVCLETVDGQRRYRIETKHTKYFENERLDPESDLAVLLIGKQQGDTFNLQDRIGSKPVSVRWIKPVHLDALHSSLEQFNERFPRTDGLVRFRFDPEAEDPLEDIRAITKARAEASLRILEEYTSKTIPLSFAAALIGSDPLDAWSGLPTVDVQFQVCRGTLPERQQATRTIHQHGRKGCVLDSITLSLVRRLGIEVPVRLICGPLYVPQSVIDLLACREFEAKQDVGRSGGYVGWRDNRLVMEEFSPESLKSRGEDRAREIAWARELVGIVPAVPKKDLSNETRGIVDVVGHAATDPAIAASGNGLILLSEDLGYRLWTEATFQIPTTWLQPVLLEARAQGYLTLDKYCEAINTLALSGHVFTSLDPQCLLHQARKDNFVLTAAMSRLLTMIGGPNADLRSNIKVFTEFIRVLWIECSEGLNVNRIISEGFVAMTQGRDEDVRSIIVTIIRQTNGPRELVRKNALAWLIGHSIGLPYLDALLELQNPEPVEGR